METALDELYALPPSDFVLRREEPAAATRAPGDATAPGASTPPSTMRPATPGKAHPYPPQASNRQVKQRIPSLAWT
ncbi:hypothetical protein [Streptomyces incanus]|uniref:Uncharacterized protein n=1 Tax=Streptomyces incanus TaxID=887453 RepID=A0ABW0XMU6_9ACTN